MILYMLMGLSVVTLTLSFSYNRSALLYARSVALLLPKTYDVVQATVSIQKFLLEQEYKIIGPLNVIGYGTGIASAIWLFTIKWYYPIIFIVGTSLWLVVTPIFRHAWVKKLRNNINLWEIQTGIKLSQKDLDKIEGK